MSSICIPRVRHFARLVAEPRNRTWLLRLMRPRETPASPLPYWAVSRVITAAALCEGLYPRNDRLGAASGTHNGAFHWHCHFLWGCPAPSHIARCGLASGGSCRLRSYDIPLNGRALYQTELKSHMLPFYRQCGSALPAHHGLRLRGPGEDASLLEYHQSRNYSIEA